MNNLSKSSLNIPRAPQNLPRNGRDPFLTGSVQNFFETDSLLTPSPHASTPSLTGRICRTTPMTPLRRHFENTSSPGTEATPTKLLLETPTSSASPNIPQISRQSFAAVDQELETLAMETKKVSSETNSPAASPILPKCPRSKL